MKCLSCDCILSDREAVRKYKSGEYLELCDGCYSYIEDDIKVLDNPLLSNSLDVHEEQNE